MKHFSVTDAKNYLSEYLEIEKDHYKIVFIKYLDTFNGKRETCGGCTLGDGQDCHTPVHYVDKFMVITERFGNKRCSYLLMGWSEGHCSNSYSDSNYIYHHGYCTDDFNKTYKTLYERYDENNYFGECDCSEFQKAFEEQSGDSENVYYTEFCEVVA